MIARASLSKVLLRGVSFTAAGAAMCLIFILLTSFAPPQDAGTPLPEAAEVEGDDRDRPPPPPEGGREIVVRVFLQGYYINDGEKKLRRARDHDGEKIVYRFQDPNQSDWITISLHDKDDYSNVLFTNSTVALNVTGYSAPMQIPDDIQQEVWVSVKHRNHLETVYFEPIDLGADFQEEVIGMDFTTAAERAYGSNQIGLDGGSVFAIYGGNVAGGPDGTQDNVIDGSDTNTVYFSARRREVGYRVTDVTGDGVVDGSDTNMTYFNARRRAAVITPN